MLNFKLTRLFWNKRATFGMLEEESVSAVTRWNVLFVTARG